MKKNVCSNLRNFKSMSHKDNPSLAMIKSPHEINYFLPRLLLSLTQGQKYGAHSENQTHWQWSTSLVYKHALIPLKKLCKAFLTVLSDII